MPEAHASDATADQRKKSQEPGIDIAPFLKHARAYSLEKLNGDARAALNVALLAIPQCMAYAAIAGLPLRYGIFGAAVAAIVAPFFADSKYVLLGPTNATSVMVMSSFTMLGIVTEDAAVASVALLLLLVGIFLTLGSVLRVATLVQYVSRTVITGYITAAATLIIANQLRLTLGFNFTPEEKAAASTFIEVLHATLRHLGETHWPTLALSLFTAAVYYTLNHYCRKLPNVAITLIAASLAAYLASLAIEGFAVAKLANLNISSWSLTLPSFTYEALRSLISPAIAIALVCMLEGNAIGKSLAARDGARINPNQEMFCTGVANIACSLFSGMAASGSVTRSQLSVDSGARTPFSSLYGGLMIAGGAYALANLIQYVPSSSLAVVVIATGISLVNKRQLRLVTKTTKSDSATFYVTFLTGLLFALDFAIYAGTVCSIALFLKKVAHPEIVEYAFDESGQLGQLADKNQRADPEVSIVHVEGELFFGAAELFRDQMRRVSDDPNLKVVVMKLRNAYNLDATSCMALEELIKYMNERDRILLVSEVRPDTLRILRNSGLVAIINPINLFEDEESNPTLSTAKALKRAKQILGGLTPKVSIYAKEKRPATPAS